MLKRLTIHNYILIDQLDIEFNKGLTIITGETGAGKSILLGALSLILGQRADATSLLNKKNKCIIEGTFDISNYDLKDFFFQNELDYDQLTCLRREITHEGKSRSFINDTPVKLTILKELADTLVDIHSQHETITLNNSRFQLSVVDTFAKQEEFLAKYRQDYHNYSRMKKELVTLKEEERKSKADQNYFQFQFNELEEANLKKGEQLALESEQQILMNASHIREQLYNAYQLLSVSEDNLIQQLSRVSTFLNSLSKFDHQYELLLERVKSSIIELKDIGSETERFEQLVKADPERLNQVEERLNLLFKLEHKHQVKSVEELITQKMELGQKLATIGTLEFAIEKLQLEVNHQHQKLIEAAGKISMNRKKAVSKIEAVVKTVLNDLLMPNALLKVEITTAPLEEFGADGIDKVVFLFTSNKNTTPKELSKVASGGEISRLMLAVKSMLASLTSMPTIIFDEIDTGISGEAASKVGSIMQHIARKHQVIAITHLPQIAGKGQEHLLVYKTESTANSRTGIRALNDEERVNEIARMLSGEKLTTAAVAHAKGLLNI